MCFNRGPNWRARPCNLPRKALLVEVIGGTELEAKGCFAVNSKAWCLVAFSSHISWTDLAINQVIGAAQL